MRKWIILALVNWLRKPANRQKAKEAWNGFRGRSAASRASRQPQASSREPSATRPGDTFDHRP